MAGVRAVGSNPEAARYGGISVGRNYFLAMAISGAFAGLAGAIDILGWQHRYGQLDIQGADLGFAGIAVALLGRNRALGIFFAAILFGALLTGTSTRTSIRRFRPGTRRQPHADHPGPRRPLRRRRADRALGLAGAKEVAPVRVGVAGSPWPRQACG